MVGSARSKRQGIPSAWFTSTSFTKYPFRPHAGAPSLYSSRGLNRFTPESSYSILSLEVVFTSSHSTQ